MLFPVLKKAVSWGEHKSRRKTETALAGNRRSHLCQQKGLMQQMGPWKWECVVSNVDRNMGFFGQ
jgi:hypothetical protein